MITISNPSALSWIFPGVGGFDTRDGEIKNWPASVPTMSQAELDALDVEYAIVEQRQRAVADLVSQIDGKAAQITGNVPEYERLSWPTKADAARAHVAGSPTADQTAMLQTEATLTGKTVDALAASIIAKADAYSGLISAMSAIRQTGADAIATATDGPGVDAALAAAQTSLDAIG